MKVVDQRLRKLLELRTDSPAMLEALSAVAAVHAASSASEHAHGHGLDAEGARRNLRSDIERRGLSVIHDFIERLAPVEEKVVAFSASVATLADACGRAARRIEQSEADTASFLAQAEALARKRDAVDRQLGEVTGFLATFELTDDEAAALDLGPVEEDGGDAFFGALERVNAIRLQSLSLLTGRDQALGIELLDAATRQQVRRPRCPRHEGRTVRACTPTMAMCGKHAAATRPHVICVAARSQYLFCAGRGAGPVI